MSQRIDAAPHDLDLVYFSFSCRSWPTPSTHRPRSTDLAVRRFLLTAVALLLHPPLRFSTLRATHAPTQPGSKTHTPTTADTHNATRSASADAKQPSNQATKTTACTNPPLDFPANPSCPRCVERKHTKNRAENREEREEAHASRVRAQRLRRARKALP